MVGLEMACRAPISTRLLSCTERGGSVSDDHSTRNDGSESADPAPEGDAAAELIELRQQLEAAEDRFLRVQAEAQNMVRRAERDVENARKVGSAYA